MTKSKKPNPAEYLTSEEEDQVTVSFRVDVELKEEFEKALEVSEITQSKFFRGQMQWLIDLVEYEGKSKRKSKRS